MKTTIELPDELALEAKQQALLRRTTLRALVISGLHRELNQGKGQAGHALVKIADVGKGDWQGVDADLHVATEREAWT